MRSITRLFIICTGMYLAIPAADLSARGGAGDTNADQERPELITDRPDQTESASVVPLYSLQIETGFLHEWEEPGKEFYVRNIEYGATLLRFGFHPRLEARLGTGLLQQRVKIPDKEPDVTTGMAPMNIGIKAGILEENGFVPDVAFIAGWQVPNTGSAGFMEWELVQTYLLALSHSLLGKWGLGCNLGFEHDANRQYNTLIYSLVLGFEDGEKTGAFIETYGNKSWVVENNNRGKMPLDTRVDAGLTYLLRPNLQLDLSGGVGLSAISPEGFISAGLTWRIPR